MQRINFQDTEVIKAPYVNINGTEYPVQSNFQGGTDLNAETFNELQDNIEEAISEVQPTIEEWKDFPTGQFTYANFLEEYKSLLFNCDISTLLDYIKESFMIVKFKYNGTTYYGCITGVGRYGLTLYTGSQTGFDTGTYSDFQYTYNKYLEEIPEDLTYNFIQFLSRNTNLGESIIGFYANQPIFQPMYVLKNGEEIVGVDENNNPIYRKTWTGTIEQEYSGSYFQNLSGVSGIDEIIKAYGYISDQNTKAGNQFYLGYNAQDMRVVKLSNGGARIDTTSSFYHKYFKITLEYTKRVATKSVELPLWPDVEIPETKGGDE